MTVPSVFSSIFYDSGSSDTAHAFTVPTAADGDIVFTVFGADGVQTITPAESGVTEHYDDEDIGGTATGEVASKAWESGDATYTFNISTSERATAVAFSVRGASGVNVLGAVNSGTGTTVSFNGATTTVADCLGIAFIVTEQDSTPHGAISGYTQIAEIGLASGASVSVYEKDLASAGSETPGNCTISASEEWISGFFAIAPAGAALIKIGTADTLALSDAGVRLMAMNRYSTDTEALTETNGRARALVRILADTLGLTEAANRLMAMVRLGTADTAAIAESIGRLMAMVRIATADTLAFTETRSTIYGYVRIATADTVAVTEAVSRVITIVKLIADTLGLTEANNRLMAMTRATADTLGLTDAQNRLMAMTRAISDTEALTEAISRRMAMVRSATDTEALTEAITRARTLARILADTVAITEANNRFMAMVRRVADTVAISELIYPVRGFVRRVSDTVAVSESIARIPGQVFVIADTVAITTKAVGNAFIGHALTLYRNVVKFIRP